LGEQYTDRDGFGKRPFLTGPAEQCRSCLLRIDFIGFDPPAALTLREGFMAAVDDEEFFDEQEPQSEVKAEIVWKYFAAWARVILPTVRTFDKKLAYIDLFSGPGVYKDGSKSTPVLIMEQILKNPDLRQRIITLFNDRSQENMTALEELLSTLPGYKDLKQAPKYACQEVGDEIVNKLKEISLVPTLLFADPFGYKGLSLSLISSVIKDFACECIFFFCYNRISPGLNNPSVKKLMDELFGAERAEELRSKVAKLTPEQREVAIVEAMSEALKANKGQYVMRFRFKDKKGTRTSHYLFFVTKNFLGYHIMKDVMFSESSKIKDGVASFEFSTVQEQEDEGPFLFEAPKPLETLAETLLDEFAGKSIVVWELYKEHSVNRPFTLKNYKDVLVKLEADGKITCNPAKRPKRKGVMTMNDKTVEVTFPAKGS
jgi:three-Cys-motif partner protein